MIETVDRAIGLFGHMLLPYAFAVALGVIGYRLTDANPIPLIIGVAVGLLWAVVGAAAWAAGA